MTDMTLEDNIRTQGRKTNRKGEGEGTGEREERRDKVSGRGREREGDGGESGFFSTYSIYLHILSYSYTFIYLQIRPNTPTYFYIPSYTPIYFQNIKYKETESRHETHKLS